MKIKGNKAVVLPANGIPELETAVTGDYSMWKGPKRSLQLMRAVLAVPPGVYRLANENPGFSFAPGIVIQGSINFKN